MRRVTGGEVSGGASSETGRQGSAGIAAREVKAWAKSGEKLSPIVIDAAPSPSSVWGKAWCRKISTR